MADDDLRPLIDAWNRLTWFNEGPMNGKIRQELNDLSISTVVTWIVAGLAAVSFFLVQEALGDLKSTVTIINTTLTNHRIDHPDRELDKRLTVLEHQLRVD